MAAGIGRGERQRLRVRCAGRYPRFPLSNARRLEPEAAGHRRRPRHDRDGANAALRRHLAGDAATSGARALRGPATAAPRRGREPHRASSSNCLPIGHRPPPCRPISCACGSPPWPMFWSTACAAFGLRHTQFADAAVATIRLKLLKLGAVGSVRASLRARIGLSGPAQRAPPSLRARIGLPEQDRIRNGLSVSAAGLQLLLSRTPWRKPSAVPPLRATARARQDSHCGKPHAAGLAIREPQTTALRPDRICPGSRKNRRCRLHTAL